MKVLEALKMLLRSSEMGEAEGERLQLRRACADPVAKEKPKVCARLVRERHERGIVEHRRSCRKGAGTLCAWKKG